MKKLLYMELKRAFLSPILWIGIAAVIAVDIYTILLTGYGYTRYVTTLQLSIKKVYIIAGMYGTWELACSGEFLGG